MIQTPTRRSLLPLTTLALLAFCATETLADTVEDREGLFAHVTILNMEDDQLVFVFNDGRTIQKPADSIKAIAVNPGNDPAADEMTRAETLRLDSKRRDAVQLYQRVVNVGGKMWIRDFALMRLVALNSDSGDLWSAYRAYSKLALTHPQLCQRIIPKRIPRKDSQVCRKILQDIDDVLNQPQPENLTAALRRMRSAILRENETPPGQVAAQPASQPADGAPPKQAAVQPPSPPAEHASSPALPTEKPVAVKAVAPSIPAQRTTAATKPPAPNVKPPAAPSPGDAAIAKGHAALKSGDLPGAEGLLEEARRLGSDASLPPYLLLDAQIALARGRARQAGVQAMKIVLENPNGEEYPEALYVAGRAHEELKRYSKALELYRKCWICPTSPPELQNKAKQRVDALTSPEAANANAPKPGDKPVQPGVKK